MTTQSEQLLEDNLIKQLTTDLGYTYVAISDEAALLANLKTQLEKHNNVRLTDGRNRKEKPSVKNRKNNI